MPVYKLAIASSVGAMTQIVCFMQMATFCAEKRDIVFIIPVDECITVYVDRTRYVLFPFLDVY